jgi:hypothetical protein
MSLPVQPLDLSRRKSQAEHLALAATLPSKVIDDVRALAAQLHGEPVLPILGAGASYDCGVRLGSEIGRDLWVEYTTDPAFEPRADGVHEDLGNVAEAIRLNRGQRGVVRAIGLHEPDLWPDMDGISDHYCAHRALARLAREAPYAQAITFNYDCGHEAGLKAEGYRRGTATALGKDFDDHMTVIADAHTNNQRRQRGFTVFKPHGCAERFRILAVDDEDRAAATIVICSAQLTHWRNANWMRDELRRSTRFSVVLLLGFSANDPVIVGEFEDVFTEIYADTPADGTPRVVVIDHTPRTPELLSLVQTGLGGGPTSSGMITEIATADASMSAVLTLLLCETLAAKLEPHLLAANVSLYNELGPRLAELTVTAPLMMRWTYLLRGREADQYGQRVNLLEAAKHGYVPLSHDPRGTVHALAARRQLRTKLGLSVPETVPEALSDYGFLVSGACGFMPVDVDHDELRGMVRPGGEPERIARSLGAPAIDTVLVSARHNLSSGFNIQTGMEVPVR